MTKKDYESIARIIRDLPENPTRVRIINDFSAMLQEDNPRFRLGQFEAACSGEAYKTPNGRTRHYERSLRTRHFPMTCKWCGRETDSPDSLCTPRCRESFYCMMPDELYDDERHPCGPEDDEPTETDQDNE